MTKIVTVVGARPQFIKCAPVSRILRKAAVEVLVHTGQHYDRGMSDVFFEQLSIPKPDYELNVGSGSHAVQTGEMLKGIEKVLQQEAPDVCLVYGDTNSTLAAALAAAKLHIPVAHVEAGLRSFNRVMPEEINRVLTDHVSSLLFCPTDESVANLAREGITDSVYQVGNVMQDALFAALEVAETQSTILENHELVHGGYYLATVHRAENTDRPEKLVGILQALATLAESGHRIVFPVHPRTRKILSELNGESRYPIDMIAPVSYLDMIMLAKHAGLILTDSGGLQNEARWLEVPCVTLREETEWTETIASGWNLLAGADPERILENAARLTSGDVPDRLPLQKRHVAARVCELLVSWTAPLRVPLGA